MPDESTQAMLALATTLARQAASLAREYLGDLLISRKPDASVVTEVDRRVEAHVLHALRDAYPVHATCAEETGNQPDPDRASARFCWVLDPIDGTRNFVSGFPCYCTSIAVLDSGRAVVGVILNHVSGDLYGATAGGGVTLNGRPVRASEVESGMDLLLGVPSSKDAQTLRVLGRWIETPGIICRNVGSTALHLAMVAAGQLSAAYCTQCKIWDMAAGVLMVEEAGGLASDPRGESFQRFDLAGDPMRDVPHVAAAPATHARLLADLRDLVA